MILFSVNGKNKNSTNKITLVLFQLIAPLLPTTKQCMLGPVANGRWSSTSVVVNLRIFGFPFWRGASDSDFQNGSISNFQILSQVAEMCDSSGAPVTQFKWQVVAGGPLRSRHTMETHNLILCLRRRWSGDHGAQVTAPATRRELSF
jgi:hypothetical protein